MVTGWTATPSHSSTLLAGHTFLVARLVSLPPYIILIPTTIYETGDFMIIPILQIRKLSHRKFKEFA